MTPDEKKAAREHFERMVREAPEPDGPICVPGYPTKPDGTPDRLRIVWAWIRGLFGR